MRKKTAASRGDFTETQGEYHYFTSFCNNGVFFYHIENQLSCAQILYRWYMNFALSLRLCFYQTRIFYSNLELKYFTSYGLLLETSMYHFTRAFRREYIVAKYRCFFFFLLYCKSRLAMTIAPMKEMF